MNQDFALVATPANARRLLLLHRVGRIDISHDVRSLAEQDCLDANVFDPLVCPYQPIKHAVAQFLLDCNLRGVVQADYHPEINPLCLLNIVRQAKPEHIVIISRRNRVWNSALTALNLTASIQSSSVLDTDRRAVVIYDTEERLPSAKLHHQMREFARWIIFDDRRGFDRLMHWSYWARLLFPAMPHPLLPRLIKDIPPDWEKLPLTAYAPFYNTCIFGQFITTPSIVAALEDEYAETRLKYNMSILRML